MRPPPKLLLMALLALSLFWVRPAYAHADLVWSDPVDSGIYKEGTLSQVALRFDETVEPRLSDIEVYGSRLQRVDLGELQVDANDRHLVRKAVADLPAGDYSVLWTVVSTADGHATTGLFQFRVGEAAGEAIASMPPSQSSSGSPPATAEMAIRWLMFASALITFGTLFFIAYVWRYARRDAIGTHFETAISVQASRLIVAAVLIWQVANFAFFLWQSMNVNQNSFRDAIESRALLTLLQTRLGHIWMVRQLVALVLLAATRRAPGGWFRGKLLLAAIMLGTVSLTSHGAATALWPAVAVLFDWLHLLASGVWLGGLVALVLLFFPSWRRQGRRPSVLPDVMRRFSRAAASAVLLSAATGVYAATSHVLDPTDVLSTGYGRTLALKILLAGGVLSVALANHQRLFKARPRLLARGIILELVLAGIVLLATAALTTLPTPPPQILEPDDVPFNGQLRQVKLPENDLQAFVSLAPNYIGWNRTMVVLQDINGVPTENAERVRVRFSLPEVGARTDWLGMMPSTNGLYVVEGQELVLVGDWQLEVDVRRPNQPDARFSLDWPITAPPTMAVDPHQPRPENWFALSLVGLSVFIPLTLIFARRFKTNVRIMRNGRHRSILHG